jgi:hypothetical protein
LKSPGTPLAAPAGFLMAGGSRVVGRVPRLRRLVEGLGHPFVLSQGERVAEMKTGGGFLETMCFFDTELFTWDGLPTIESLKDPPRNTMRVE